MLRRTLRPASGTQSLGRRGRPRQQPRGAPWRRCRRVQSRRPAALIQRPKPVTKMLVISLPDSTACSRHCNTHSFANHSQPCDFCVLQSFWRSFRWARVTESARCSGGPTRWPRARATRTAEASPSLHGTTRPTTRLIPTHQCLICCRRHRPPQAASKTSTAGPPSRWRWLLPRARCSSQRNPRLRTPLSSATPQLPHPSRRPSPRHTPCKQAAAAGHHGRMRTEGTARKMARVRRLSG